MIRMLPEQLRAIRGEAERGYPEEICGVLIGRDGEGQAREVVRSLAVANARSTERARRYLIDAGALLAAERAAAAEDLEIIGFYHSHPDHPALPSEFDREHSWPYYTYLIVSVRTGRAEEARAWRLSDDRSGFMEEDIAEVSG